MIDMLKYLRTLEDRLADMAKKLAEQPASDHATYQRRVGQYSGIKEACDELRKLMRKEYGEEDGGDEVNSSDAG